MRTHAAVTLLVTLAIHIAVAASYAPAPPEHPDAAPGVSLSDGDHRTACMPRPLAVAELAQTVDACGLRLPWARLVAPRARARRSARPRALGMRQTRYPSRRALATCHRGADDDLAA